MLYRSKGSVKKSLVFVTYCSLMISFVVSDVYAFGKKRKEPAPDPNADTLAFPTRTLGIARMYDAQFMLPDGKTPVNLGALVPEILKTEIVAATRKFRIMADPGDNGADLGNPGVELPATRYVIRAGVVAFEAEIFKYGITFGYRKGGGNNGDIGKGKLDANVKVKGRVGLLQMDFHIFDTQNCEVRDGRRSCALVAYGKADSHSSHVSGEFELNFGEFKGGSDFVYNDSIAKIFRKIINDAIVQMVANPETNFNMDWTANVSRLNNETQRVTIPFGEFDEIALNNVFLAYDNDGIPLGTLKVKGVEFDQSVTEVKDDPNGKIFRSIRLGDRVKIKKVKPQTNQ